MKRLFSYTVYVTMIMAPLLPGIVICDNMNRIIKGDVSSIIGSIFFLGIGCYFAFLLFRSRRVYYKDSSLYIYSLFSNKLVVIGKDDIGGIEKFSFLDPANWKITYYDKNQNAKYVYFIRNPLCDDFIAIIDELN